MLTRLLTSPDHQQSEYLASCWRCWCSLLWSCFFVCFTVTLWDFKSLVVSVRKLCLETISNPLFPTWKFASFGYRYLTKTYLLYCRWCRRVNMLLNMLNGLESSLPGDVTLIRMTLPRSQHSVRLRFGVGSHWGPVFRGAEWQRDLLRLGRVFNVLIPAFVEVVTRSTPEETQPVMMSMTSWWRGCLWREGRGISDQWDTRGRPDCSLCVIFDMILTWRFNPHFYRYD